MEDIIRELLRFTNENLLKGAADDLQGDTPLLELGVLDSLSMVELLSFIDERFGVRISEDDVVPEHFQDLDSVAALIAAENAETPTETQAEAQKLVALQVSQGLERQVMDLGEGRTAHCLRTPGPGPTWLLLPALGNPSTSWGPMMRALIGKQACVALDLAGFGLSSVKTEAPSFADQLDLVLAVADRIDGPLVLVANSAGAMLGTEVARRRQHQVTGLVVTGFGLIEDVDRWWQALQALADSPEQFLERAYHNAPKLTPALQRLLLETLSRPAYHGFLDAPARTAMASTFDDLDLPVLFVGGQSDRIIPAEAVEAAAARVPGARLEWLARCGHFAPAERPDHFLWMVQDFTNSLAKGGDRV